MPKRSRNDKKPAFASIVEATKKPRVAVDPTLYYDANPAWRIIRMEFHDPFGWHEVDADTLRIVHSKLAEFERLTWREILSPDTGNHQMPTDRICKEAQERLRELKLDEVDSLISLRLKRRVRVWGLMDRGVLNLLWWDPEHGVYPMNIADN